MELSLALLTYNGISQLSQTSSKRVYGRLITQRLRIAAILYILYFKKKNNKQNQKCSNFEYEI